jgi:hypothetical protein
MDIKIKTKDDYFIKDEVTKAVVMDLFLRAERGETKYNTTLHENNHDDFMNHLYEELLDAAQYIKKEIIKTSTIQDLIKQHPNDANLGEAIRIKYGKKA